MSADWTIFEIAAQVQLASHSSREVERILIAARAPVQDTAMLLSEIGNLALAHESVLRRLRDTVSPQDPSLEIAEKLAAHWWLLSTALVAKISELETEEIGP